MGSVEQRADSESDLIVVGGGIVGLATAWRFVERFPQLRVTVLEKEPRVADHQTGRNSGVLHSGIYYKPGSLKAINCREGKLAMEQFCEEEQIPYDRCGKVIVATDSEEVPRLAKILERGVANGVACRRISAAELKEFEPHVAGVEGIHVPETGIVNYRRVAEKLSEKLTSQGSRVVTSAEVLGIVANRDGVVAETTQGAFVGAHLVNCGGLYCDRIARQAGLDTPIRIVPFRGEYFEIGETSEHLVRNLIYPVPDPSFPFLGVHFTRMIEGGIECGPNAVMAFAREGYTKTTVNLRDLGESLAYGGFRKLAMKHWAMGLGEMWRSFSRSAFTRALQRLVPEIQERDLKRAPAGVRAQAVAANGELVDDFLIEEQPRCVHVLNAPSPAATASLNIGRVIVDRLAERFS